MLDCDCVLANGRFVQLILNSLPYCYANLELAGHTGYLTRTNAPGVICLTLIFFLNVIGMVLVAFVLVVVHSLQLVITVTVIFDMARASASIAHSAVTTGKAVHAIFTRWFRFSKPFSIRRVSISNSGVSLLLAFTNASILPLFPSLT